MSTFPVCAIKYNFESLAVNFFRPRQWSGFTRTAREGEMKFLLEMQNKSNEETFINLQVCSFVQDENLKLSS